MTEEARDLRTFALAAVLIAIVGLVCVDVISDHDFGAEPLHVAIEGGIMLLAAAGGLVLWRRGERARVQLRQLGSDVERWRAEAHDALRGLGTAIDQQFERWRLTDAEREVGLLLLKALSHKEIAAARATSERTVRQQALALYRKAGLAGRAELAAFFLEDLLIPRCGKLAP